MSSLFRSLCSPLLILLVVCGGPASSSSAGDPEIVNLYAGGSVPGFVPEGPERDTTPADGRTVAGNQVIRLGGVSKPQLHIFEPEQPAASTVIVLPGGGFHILAWDLEGTEIAHWLQSQGVRGAVLKYRTPTADQPVKYLSPVLDAHRAVEQIRQRYPKSAIGLLGFSAGGHTVAQTVFHHGQPEELPVGNASNVDFVTLVYPAYLVNDAQSTGLVESLRVTGDSPPTFLAHAADDRLTSNGSTLLHAELIRQGVSSELHVFASGGHGFGGRVSGDPTDAWRSLCEKWMRTSGWMPPK